MIKQMWANEDGELSTTHDHVYDDDAEVFMVDREGIQRLIGLYYALKDGIPFDMKNVGSEDRVKLVDVDVIIDQLFGEEILEEDEE